MFANPFFGKLSDRTSSQLGMRRPWMVVGLVGGSVGILVVALAPNIPVVLVGMVHRPGVLQRAARRPGRGAARPGPGRATRHGRRHPRRLRARRVGGRHLPGQGVHRQPGRHVPGSVRGRRRSSSCSSPSRCTTGGLAAADKPTWSLRELAEHVLRQPADAARTSRGRSPAASCSSWPTRSWSPTRRTTCWTSSAAPKPTSRTQIFLGTLVQSVVVVIASPLGGQALGLDGAAEGLRPRARRSSTGWRCS